MRLALFLVVLAIAGPAASQSGTPPASVDSVAVLFSQNRLAEALPYARRAVARRPRSIEARAALADVLWRVGQAQRNEALVAEAARVAADVVAREACHTQALLTQANALLDTDPDAAAEALSRAVVCSPDDGNVWLAFWTDSVRSGRLAGEWDPLSALHRLGFWSGPMRAFARLTLDAAPADAILLADGVSDGAALRTVQEVEGVRPDVVVVPFEFLDRPAVLRALAARGVSVPTEPEVFQPRIDARGSRDTPDGRLYTLADAILDRWRADDRPLVGAITLNPLVLGSKGGVVDRGILLAPGEASTFDPDAASAAFDGIDAAAFNGPPVTAQDRDPARRASPFDPGGVVLFQMLQTAVSHAQEGDATAAETAYRQAVAFAQNSGRADEPLVFIAREWVDEALASD